MSRMAGIPSRIVTGYKADLSIAINNYIAIKEKDAHAWAEIYLDDQWVRVETTSTASSIESKSLVQLTRDRKDGNILLKKLNLYLMYTKYQVERWRLHYSNIRQLELLSYVKKNPTVILLFIFAMILLILFTILIISYYKKPHYDSEALELLQPLLNRLKQSGFIRQKEETLHQYLLRYINQGLHTHEELTSLLEVDNSYQETTYGKEKSFTDIKRLRKLVKNCLKTVKP